MNAPRWRAKTTAAPALIRKTSPIEIKAIDELKGVITAYVNSLDVLDYDNEVIASGAFDASIKAGLPAVAWMHDQRTIVGGVTSAKEEKKRLLAEMQFDLDTEPGAYAFKMVARGRVREWSVGFYASSWRMEERDQKSVRVLEAVEWVEVSPVLKGASPGTQTTAIKQQESDGGPSVAAVLLASAESGRCTLCHEMHTDYIGKLCPHGAPKTCPAAYACDACRLAGDEALADPTDGPSDSYTRGLADQIEERRRWLVAQGIEIPLVVGSSKDRPGARASAGDVRRVQAAHDLMAEMGAMCSEDNVPKAE